MKKVRKASRIDDLMVDAIDYTFTEWLVRQGLFCAYKANCERSLPGHVSFRDSLRAKIRRLCHSSVLGIESIISTSFPFVLTPEGYDFWKDQSNLWQRFCSKFKSTL